LAGRPSPSPPTPAPDQGKIFKFNTPPSG
jgi:hypothetical protein